jgi:hypothetical protein
MPLSWTPFFEQHPILDTLWTIVAFVAAWCLATLVMAFVGYFIHNGFWRTEPRRLYSNGNGGTAATTGLPPAPRLEGVEDGTALGSSATSIPPSPGSGGKPGPSEPLGRGG